METVIRVVLIYVLILAGVRILGKRELGEFSPLELITLLLIPELVAQGVVREDFSFTNAVIGLSTLFALVFLFSLVRYLNQNVEELLTGTPKVLISDGQFVEENMNRERIDPQELFGEIHKAGLYRLNQVKWAILESDGQIAIIANEERETNESQSDTNTAI